MDAEEQLGLAKEYFNKPGQRVVGVDSSQPPKLIVHVEDDYGRLECTIPFGDLFDEVELHRSLETHANGRATKIAEWEYQKKLAAEMIRYLNGEPDPKGRMRWLPRLLLERFRDDFHLNFPVLKSYVTDPSGTDVRALQKELETVPKSWQRSD
jgi:hypothetical protein